jgi:hypothetical protein
MTIPSAPADVSNTPAPSEAPVSTETARHDALEKTQNTLDASIDNAFDKVFGDNTKSQEQASQRDDKGRFAAKATDTVATPAAPVQTAAPTATLEAKPSAGLDVPARFSPDAKAAWSTIPDSVKGEVNRTLGEIEQGIKTYQEKYAPLKPYEEMAAQAGSTLDVALRNYTNMEQAFAQSPVQGFETLCNFIGKDPAQFIAEITGQQPPPITQQDNTIRSLQQQVQQLTEQITGVSTTIQSQQDAEMEQNIMAWASDKPRFTELRETMAKLAQSGMANDLDSAYEMADRLIPSAQRLTPAAVTPATTQAKPNLLAQTQKGQLSTVGAPVSGSNPAYRKPAASAAEAIDRSFAQLGIG